MDIDDKIALIRLRIGDVRGNPLYPMFTPTDYEMSLESVNGNITLATRQMAISASMLIAGYNTREVIGDLAMENEFARIYQRSLEKIMADTATSIPDNLFAWSASSEVNQTKLMKVADISCRGQAKVNRKGGHL